MKNSRALAMLGLALLAGFAAVIFASKWLLESSTSSMAPVVVAVSDTDLGTPLTGTMVRVVRWPKDSIPLGAISDPKVVVGRVVRTSLTPGDPVLESKLAPDGAAGGLSALIGPGYRAITVRVNDVVGVAGFALPGNYVDVIVNTQLPTVKNGTESSAQSVSKIVLEKILVLAVAQQVNRDDTAPKVVNAVTLEVTPEQAEKLDLARSVGSLSLVLRNQVDAGTVASEAGATKSSLLGAAPIAVPMPAAPQLVAAHPGPPRVHTGRRDCVGVLAGISSTQECF